MNTHINPCAPHLALPHLGVVRTAAAIAATDAAERLLGHLYVGINIAESHEYREIERRARGVAEELCGYAALAEESAAFFLRSVAQIHYDNPQYNHPIVEGLVLLGQISGQRRVA